MKIEIVATRDPDGENEYAVFVDGVRDDSAVQIYDIDPGRGYSRSDWLEFRTIEGASPAANDYHEQTVDSYVHSEWIEDE